MSKNESTGFIDATKEWLRREGFPLEMKVAKSFQESGFGVRQGWHFRDPDEDKSREIDVLASLESNTAHPYLIQAIVECKYIQYPFLVFSYPGGIRGEPDPDLQQGNSVGRMLLRKVASQNRIGDLPIYATSHPISYDVRQIPVRIRKREKKPGKRGFKDEAFDALNKVAKATSSNISYYEKRHPAVRKQMDQVTSYTLAYLAFPLIVVDGPILGCYLDASGSLEVFSVESALVNWSNPLVGNIPIHVYSINELPHFVSKLVRTHRALSEIGIEL